MARYGEEVTALAAPLTDPANRVDERRLRG
jgi:hypothetical protein